MNEPENNQQPVAQERVQAIVDSLAGFCHALGQPATVLLSSVELMKMEGVDAATRKEVLNVCYDAVLEIKNLLAEMKNRREYLAQAYLCSSDLGGTIAAMPEWSERMPTSVLNALPRGTVPPPRLRLERETASSDLSGVHFRKFDKFSPNCE